MRLDAQLIKERTSVKELFERDGHTLRKMGASYVCMCPFHQEKTASCHVHETYFHCFGCGEGGDCFKYLQLTRKLSFPEAVAQLSNGAVSGPAIAAPTREVKKVESLPERMQGKQLEAWLAGIERLKNAEDRQQAMALWRGYSIETVKFAIEHGVIALVPFMGEWREAFLVERCEPHGQLAETGERVPIGYHMRLGPHTAGNGGDKASWRYLPTGIGAWPFVLGNVAKAKIHFFLEGQWDALALVDVMQWSKSEPDGRFQFPQSVAVIGMRGATSWRRFVEHYKWNEDETVAFALADADVAGRGWFSEKGFIEAVRLRYRHLAGFTPSVITGSEPDGRLAIKDFNDLTKARLISRDALATLFRDKMKQKVRGRRAHGPTFLQFCRRNKKQAGLIGDGARIVADDKRCPGGRKPLPIWERYLYRCVPKEQHPAFYAAWREWIRGGKEQKAAA
jgi:CHC2 zinc finger